MECPFKLGERVVCINNSREDGVFGFFDHNDPKKTLTEGKIYYICESPREYSCYCILNDNGYYDIYDWSRFIPATDTKLKSLYKERQLLKELVKINPSYSIFNARITEIKWIINSEYQPHSNQNFVLSDTELAKKITEQGKEMMRETLQKIETYFKNNS